jgi:ABC-type glycerol-3-phosphate transport system substrate-binding protein
MKHRILAIPIALLLTLSACATEPALPTRLPEATPSVTPDAEDALLPTPAPEETVTITLTAGDYWKTYLDAKSKAFMRENSGVDVQVRYLPYYEEADPSSAYVMRMAADLAGGAASDLIDVWTLPTVKYARLGLIDEQGLAGRLQEKMTLYLNE